ncbi:MAG TPA: alpha/beta hydrolase [Chryseolinea sp.]|nr:alpha/beta hydrolase [Chryseolinea sp.]
MPSKQFHFRKSTLHYTTLGNGPHHLLMFHGFGQDNNSFHSLSHDLANHYTAYIFDLYFHGQSTWGYDDQPLTKQHWKETLQAFFQEHQIENFYLAGFSMGGKFVLATLEAFPEKTQGIILLAPDGIKLNFWYFMATYPVLFRKLFRKMVHQPKLFHAIANALHQLGWVDKGVLKFATYQMNSEEKRNRVYYSWVVFRQIRVDLDKIAGLINRLRIPITIVVGQFDKVIQAKDMKPLVKKVSQCTFETPPVGHTGLILHSGEYFKNFLPRT